MSFSPKALVFCEKGRYNINEAVLRREQGGFSWEGDPVSIGHKGGGTKTAETLLDPEAWTVLPLAGRAGTGHPGEPNRGKSGGQKRPTRKTNGIRRPLTGKRGDTKMKKTWLAALLAALLLTSCSGNTAKDVDIEALAQEIVQTVAFDDTLEEIDDSMIPMLYDIDGYTDAVLYKGSGATAEEVALFKMESSDDAKTACEEAKAHIQSQIEAYESYMPDEVTRLEDAVVRQDGNYVSIVVSADPEAAEKLLEDSF